MTRDSRKGKTVDRVRSSVVAGAWGLHRRTEVFRAVKGLPGSSVVKDLPANAGDTGDMDLILGSGRFPGVGNGNTLQYSCLENSMDRGAWQAKVHGVTKSWTQLSN